MIDDHCKPIVCMPSIKQFDNLTDTSTAASCMKVIGNKLCCSNGLCSSSSWSSYAFIDKA